MPIVEKIHRLESAESAFLDHSKTLAFIDVIITEIPVKYSRAHAIRTYSSRAKKTMESHLNFLRVRAMQHRE